MWFSAFQNTCFGHSPCKGKCPKAELKEVKERKRNSSARMTKEITAFLCSKAVISANENSKNGLKVL